MRLFIAGALMALVLAICFYAEASRNSSGTMSTLNTFVSGTTISSTNVNANFADIATEITDSLDRSGKGPMLAPLRLTNGTFAAPSLTFDSDTDTGIYRIGANNLGVTANGAKVLDVATTGLGVTGTLSASGDVTASTKLGVGGAPTNMLDLTIAGTASTTVGTWFEASLADGNSVTFDIGKSISSGGTGFLAYTKNATAVNSTFCMWVFGGSNTLCVDGNNKAYTGTGGFDFTSNSSGGISTGIAVNGSGLKHQSVAGCATGASIGATCDSTLTWSTTFADTNYQAYCSCNAAASGIPTIGRYTIAAGSVIVATVAGTAAAAQCSLVTCLAVHN